MGNHLLLYILKRIILMIPTLAIILLVCFLVLNLTPGRPGGTADGGDAISSDAARQQYRLFKETFNFDKPILFNTYFLVEKDEVEALISTTLDTTIDPAPRAQAQNQLEDYGRYIVPILIQLLDEDPSLERLEHLCLLLSINAQKRNLFLGRASKIPDDLKEEQRKISRHNKEVARWRLDKNATPSEQRALTQQWQHWYREHAEEFKLDNTEKLSRFFTDTRFFKYFNNLLHGDFGYTTKLDPVLPEVLKRLKYSFTLSLLSIILTYLIAVPLGVLSATKRNTPIDRLTTLTLFLLYALPTFFVGTLIVQHFPNGQPFFTSGFESSSALNPTLTAWDLLVDIAKHIFLPVIVLTYANLAMLSRYTRSGLLEVIRADYIRTAQAKGLTTRSVIFKHALRNALLPIITLLGALLPALISGSVVVEVIFEIDGIGRYLLHAIMLRDYAVVMAILLLSSIMTLIGVLAADIAYALADPRITFE